MSTHSLQVHADVVAAETVDYHRISVTAAARGDYRTAILAEWASDVRALQSLLWEAGLAEVADPVAELRGVADAVEQGLRELPSDPEATGRVRDLLERARAALANAFDPSVHELLFARFQSLDHLDAMDVEERPGPSGSDRLAGEPPERRQAALRAAASDSLAAARALAAAGDTDAADRQTWQAALASFEAFLVGLALRLGDHQLTTVDLHWELAAGRLAVDDASFPGPASLLPRLQSVLGPPLRPKLQAEFATAGEWPW